MTGFQLASQINSMTTPAAMAPPRNFADGLNGGSAMLLSAGALTGAPKTQPTQSACGQGDAGRVGYAMLLPLRFRSSA
jgi:hypothetical protein